MSTSVHVYNTTDIFKLMLKYETFFYIAVDINKYCWPSQEF